MYQADCKQLTHVTQVLYMCNGISELPIITILCIILVLDQENMSRA